MRRVRFAPTSPAFTLIELLVVIGIIVVVVLLTLPVLNVLQGNRSADAAQNQVQALINEARMNAIGLQRDSGVMFYIDPNTRRVQTVLVQATDPLPQDSAFPNVDVFLDLVRDHESVPLTLGLSLQTMDNATVVPGSPPTRSDDGYIGYNTGGGTIEYGGVILFDSHGQLVSRSYAFRTFAYDINGNGIPTEMAKLLYVTPPPTPPPIAYVPGLSAGAIPPQSSFGFVVFNSEAYKSYDCSEADAQQEGGGFFNKKDAKLSGYDTPGTTSRSEQQEEEWIDQNSVPFLINRYNGTLVRGE